MFLKIAMWILITLGLICLLTIAVCYAIFLIVFHRFKNKNYEDKDLSKTVHSDYKEQMKQAIINAKKLSYEKIHIKADDGTKLFGRYFETGSKTTIILVHGYRSNGFNTFGMALEHFLQHKYNVLLIDQRAHGESSGKYSTLSYKEQFDVLNWISWLDGNKKLDNILLYGISMGSSTIAMAMSKIQNKKVKAAILEAGFPSFAEQLMWVSKVKSLNRLDFRCVLSFTKNILKIDITQSSDESLANTNIPILFLHGDQDASVPLKFTQRSFEACKSEKKLLVVKNAKHTNCFVVGGQEVQKQIFDFLDKKLN